ncbi:cell envelope integrity protein TolA [Hydrogenophaga sp. IBVHS1]|uniref:cell envelope integrity protein TolA n=1 Tax=unclassified Hydrogenophaga TaxID=2610897 RepID=UPI000A2DDB47|nr:cell envelope integrity protein TolA [Hydrogenophaga sp. IBVHS1]OSZ75904.1 protein TolA [Hydrogenophaga sp. IBVHS1]
MQSTADHLDLAPPRNGRWLGPMGLALVAHGLLVIALTMGVQWQHDAEPMSVEAELWSRTPQQAAPREVAPPPPPPQVQQTPTPPPPKPAPAPTPAPPPPGPTQAEIATAQAKKKAEADKREREEEAKKLAAQKAAADKLAAERKAAAEKAAAEKERQQKLAEQKREQERKEAAEEKRLAQAREDQIKRMMGQAGATGGPQSTGTAQQSSGPTPGYAGRVAARIRPNVVFTDMAPGNPRAEVEVRTQPDGTITSRKLVKSSGNAAWDEAVLRAIDRTATLPKDTNGTVPSSMVIGLRPLD